jgi:hypothetical protein
VLRFAEQAVRFMQEFGGEPKEERAETIANSRSTQLGASEPIATFIL